MKSILFSVAIAFNLFNTISSQMTSTEVFYNICPELYSGQLAASQEYVDGVQRFLEYLAQQNITVTADQPGYGFFLTIFSPLSDESLKLFTKSEVAVHLAKLLTSALYFGNPPPQHVNLQEILRFFTPCFKKFFDSFCVSNAQYSCANRNMLYRSSDGTCNSVQYPKRGSYQTHFNMMLTPIFDDGIQTLRKSLVNRAELPEPRILVNKFLDTCGDHVSIVPKSPNMGSIMYGQLITHDVSLRPMPQTKRGGDGIQCCTKDGSSNLPANETHPDCIPIKIRPNDRTLPNIGCMNYVRTQTVVNNDCELTSRLPVNLQTSFLDLSNVYGATTETTNKLRSFVNGRMKMNANRVFGVDENNKYIFGDVRIDQTPVLAFLHSIWTRYHNKIAEEIKLLRPLWNDEIIFQESRRFVTALHQQIVWYEWIPTLQGSQTLRLPIFNMNPDPTTSSEFAHSVFRYLHRLNPEFFSYYNNFGIMTEKKTISDAIGSTTELEVKYDDVARGTFYQPAIFDNCRIENLVRLFKNSKGIGIDLFSTDILRGRDHGVPPYYVFVELCHGIKVTSFMDLLPLITILNIFKLQTVYASVFDIDLYIGALVEIVPADSFVSPTSACISNEQFSRWARGDRYFFENPNNPHPFTPNQMAQIRKASFAEVLCQNTGLTKVPVNAFLTYNPITNPLVSCNTIPKVQIVY